MHWERDVLCTRKDWCKMIGWIILGIFVAFIVVIVERTLLFVPEKMEKLEAEEIVLDEDTIVKDMARLYQTVLQVLWTGRNMKNLKRKFVCAFQSSFRRQNLKK